MLWVGAGLAVLAAALLAFVPRLPSSTGPQGFGLAGASLRITGTTNRRLKVFALVQIAACFVLVSAAAANVNTLLSLQSVKAAFNTHRVVAVNPPILRNGKKPNQVLDFYRKIRRRYCEL